MLPQTMQFRPGFFRFMPYVLFLWIGIFFLPAPSAPSGAEIREPGLEIFLQKGEVLFSAEKIPLKTIVKGFYDDFDIRIIGLEERGAEPVTYTIIADSLQGVIRGLMRHLEVKNYALEDIGGKLSRVSVFPEARHTVSIYPPRPDAVPVEKGKPKKAVEVLSIIDDSQAQNSDLKKGDIIVTYDGKKITRAAELVKESRKKSPDESVELLVMREGEQVRVNINGGFIGIRIKTIDLPTEPGLEP